MEKIDGKIRCYLAKIANGIILYMLSWNGLQGAITFNSFIHDLFNKGQDITKIWIDTSMKARTGKKISRDISKNLRTTCWGVFLMRAKHLEQNIPDDRLENFRQKANAIAFDLLEKASAIQDDPYYNSRMKIICMDILIDNAIIGLRREFDLDEPQTNEAFIEGICKTEKGYRLIRKFALANLCLQGGGGKGFGFAGALAVLAKAGKLNHLQSVSGSSVGAITATAIGFGIPYESLGDFCVKVQDSLSREKSTKTLEHYPSLGDIFTGFAAKGKAAGIIQALDIEMAENVKNFLNQDEVKKFLLSQKTISEKNRVLESHEIGRLQRLQNAPIPNEDTIKAYESRGKHFQRDEDDMLKFNDLELLRKIQGTNIQNPFKEIILTGWDTTAQKEVYFCARKPKGIAHENFKPTPHMPIAYAVRISMALPTAFSAIKMNLTKYQHGGLKIKSPHRFVDGGLGSNSPIEVFIRPLSSSPSEAEHVRHQMAQARTLNCIFDREGDAFKKDHHRSLQREYKLMDKVTAWLFYFLNNIQSPSDQPKMWEGDDRKINATGNNLIVGHGQLGTFSMSPTAEEKAAASTISSLLAIEWCQQHENEIAMIESSSLKAILKNLSIEELQDLQSEDESIQKSIQEEIEQKKRKAEDLHELLD